MKILIRLAVAGVLFAGTGYAAETLETPPVLKAADLAPKGLPLKGDRYRVEDEVPTDGYLATFTIRSDFGTVEARGPGVLRLRLAEVDALAALEQLEAGAPRGTEAGTNQQNVAVDGGVAAGKAVRDALGYDEQRRHLARSLKVDPYTTNPILKKKLDQIAWAAFAGGLGVDAVAARVPGSKLIQSTSLLTAWIYEKPPGDLKVWIEKSLQGTGVAQATIDHFLRQKYWAMTTQTALVMALEKLKGAKGLGEVLDTAVTAESEDQARFLAAGMSLLAREHEKTPITEVVGGKPVGLTAEGRALVAAPVDYISWTERMAAFVGREDLASRRPLVLVAGRLSPRV